MNSYKCTVCGSGARYRIEPPKDSDGNVICPSCGSPMAKEGAPSPKAEVVEPVPEVEPEDEEEPESEEEEN